MTTYDLLQMLGYVFNILGLLVCIGGLTLARRPDRRLLGRSLAVLGFVIAAAPVLVQLLGLVEPVPVSALPPR
ncbi:hypothetical protein DFP85_104160 [Halomonas ventosae]|jgi:hypothetical protein|uniref:Uncharacterized protein n=1 Tax=Halomonas ventosae TaxID=229007 RepID=A0A4R6ZUC5_9GAMM|nr:hypothetical protein [Halomonas ventosae]TDR56238.1 hypothetical protein DFP85_104160 [Halomonas ventosae]